MSLSVASRLPVTSDRVIELGLLAFSSLCAVIALVLFVRMRLQARAARARAADEGVGSMRDALERRLERSSEPWV